MKKTRRCRDPAVGGNQAEEGMRGVGGEAHDAAAGGEVEGEGEGNPGECQVGSGERRMGRRSKGERSMEEVRVLKFYFVGYSWSFLGFKFKKRHYD